MHKYLIKNKKWEFKRELSWGFLFSNFKSNFIFLTHFSLKLRGKKDEKVLDGTEIWQ